MKCKDAHFAQENCNLWHSHKKNAKAFPTEWKQLYTCSKTVCRFAH